LQSRGTRFSNRAALFIFVMPGLVPGIHAFEAVHRLKAWMAAEFGLARIRQGF
jgi:hypothetical protein